MLGAMDVSILWLRGPFGCKNDVAQLLSTLGLRVDPRLVVQQYRLSLLLGCLWTLWPSFVVLLGCVWTPCLRCRLMVDVPDVENRAKILSVILKDEDLAPDVDIQELARVADGYTGSDLRVGHSPSLSIRWPQMASDGLRLEY